MASDTNLVGLVLHNSTSVTHRNVLAIALPMIASNLMVPLLSLVDTAVVGHLEHTWYLGGVALGSSLISLLFLLLVFLRMSTTGLTAQAFGAGDKAAMGICLIQAAQLAMLLSVMLLLLHPFVMPLAQLFTAASSEVLEQAGIYFQLRIWSAPAALLKMVLLGWFLGLHNARYPMWLLLCNQSLNIILDLVFVLGFGWKVAGVAAASVIADYATLALGLLLLRRVWRQHRLGTLPVLQLLPLRSYRPLVALNRDIFIRSLCLQLVFAFIAFRGASLGDSIVAANAVLLSFLMLVSYAMDGFAYAAEAITGKAVGAKDQRELTQLFVILAQWGLALGLLFSLVLWLGGPLLINLLTSISAIQQRATDALPWLIALPLLSVWSYLLDGIYIGATQGRAMRNTMLLACAGFMLCYSVTHSIGNHALWLALSLFMLLRGVCLALPLFRQGPVVLFKRGS